MIALCLIAGKGDSMKILSILEEFLLDRSAYCAPATLRTYESHIRKYIEFLYDIYGDSFDLVPEKHLINYILWLRQHNPDIRNVSIRSYFRAIKAFLKYAYENDYCMDYLKKLKLPKDDSEPKNPLTVDEAAALDAAFNKSSFFGLRNYCIIHLMLDCGLRSQEVRNLKWQHLDQEKNILYIKDSKGKKSRFTLCPSTLFMDLEKLPRNGSFIFQDSNNKPISSNCIKQLFQDLKKQSGVNRVHAHLLRHTFATSFLLGGGNMEFLRVFMGHSDYSVTQNYTQLSTQCKMLGIDVYHLDPIFFERGY